MSRALARIQAGGSATTSEMREDLARLEKRYAEVKQELHALAGKVDERATPWAIKPRTRPRTFGGTSIGSWAA